MQAVSEFSLPWLAADWALSRQFVAGTTLSRLPASTQGFNLARPTEDVLLQTPPARQQLLRHLPDNRRLLWLSQTHSAVVTEAADYQQGISADALISRNVQDIPVVLTADCLPLVIAAKDGSVWAAVHAGWRGLYHEIIAATIKKTAVAPETLAAWLGPCIRRDNYEVDAAFYQRFVEKNRGFAAAFLAGRSGHYLADLTQIARLQLQNSGVTEIADCGICSYADKRFFSYRRQAAQAGRMATFITPRQ